MGMKTDRRTDIGMAANKIDHGPDLGLTCGIGTSARLLILLAPVGGEVSVEIKSLAVRIELEFNAVMLQHPALGKDAVIAAADLTRLSRNHHPGVFRVRLPSAVGISNTHRQYPPVAVDVLDDHAVQRIVLEGIGAG